MRGFFVSVVCFVLPVTAAADVSGRVDVRTAAGATAAPTIVFAEPLDRQPPSRPITARLVQKDKTFIPGVVVVPVGSTVDFPNHDPIFHNVFSLSPPAPFDLGLYRSGASKERKFTQPGSYRVFCNIHPQMTAFIVVAPTPYVAIAGPDGRFTLDLPPGSYRVTARSDRAAPVSAELTVRTGAENLPNLTVDESHFVALPHKNKFGREYPVSAYEKKGR